MAAEILTKMLNIPEGLGFSGLGIKLKRERLETPFDHWLPGCQVIGHDRLL